ncbi:MAG: diguanylate cyclase/phosphodiesterase [Deltaproteobacteria bacterium]|nr:diguanylate cyclase/phosphodiesterase [Deltaproteobacteria bacterium]
MKPLSPLCRLFCAFPLRQKLMAITLLTSAIVLSVAVSALIVNETITSRRAIREELLALADIAGKNAAAAIMFNDQHAANETLAGLSANPRIIGAYLLDQDGRLFASYHLSGEAEAQMWREKLNNADSLRDWGHGFPVAKKILVDGKPVGTVVIHSDMVELHKKLRLFLGVVAMIMLASSALAYLLARWLQGLISRPVMELATAMKRVSTEKNYALRATAASNDEIGDLIGGFNEMLGEIEARDEILKQRQEHLQLLAHFDTLTRLPNRMLFNDRLTQALYQAGRTEQKMAVMFVDLDHFKDINDTFGHRIGDLLLELVAVRLQHIIRSCDTVARMGGDEFTLFVQDVKTAENACLVAQKIGSELADLYLIEGKEVFVTASIGIALFPEDGMTVDELLRCADTAMYQAKENGKNHFEFYSKEMNVRTSQRLEMQKHLCQALERDELELYYQPKVAVASGRVTGMEALVRWRHPDQGMIPPGRFISLAEESGLIIRLGEWVLRSACQQVMAWQAEGYEPLRVAVNVSGYQFRRQNFAATVAGIVAETGFDPAFLELELTESTIMRNVEATVGTLNALKEMGVHIAIDDFGIGYSSLSQLKRFPIDSLKIDRSFICNVTSSKDDLAIVVAIIAMARSLGLKIIAEGVETAEQMAVICEQGCHEMQGYHFSRPVPAMKFIEFLRRREAAPRLTGDLAAAVDGAVDHAA